MKMTEEEKQSWKEAIKKNAGPKGLSDKDKHIWFLLDHAEIFNTGRFKENILKNEFDNMTEEKKAVYKNALGIDFATMKQIVDIFHALNITII